MERCDDAQAHQRKRKRIVVETIVKCIKFEVRQDTQMTGFGPLSKPRCDATNVHELEKARRMHPAVIALYALFIGACAEPAKISFASILCLRTIFRWHFNN